MHIYFFLIIFWIISYLAINRLSLPNKKKSLAFLYGGSMFLIMGLRHYSVGSDIEHYLDVFNNEELWGPSFLLQFEYGYFAYLKILKIFNVSNQGYIIITSLIICYSFASFFYKYSDNILLSFFLHLTIGIFTVTMSAIRQSLAISIILFAITLLLERRLLFFTIVVLFASTFHRTAIFFILVTLFVNVKNISLNRGIILYSVLILTLFIKKYILYIIIYLIPNKFEQYLIPDSENAINKLLIVIAFIIPLFILIFWKYNSSISKKQERMNSLFFVMTIISSTLFIIGLIIPMITRLAYYFIPAYIVLIPNIIGKLELKQNKIILYLTIIVFCLVYFVLSTIDGTLEIDNFKFFWK